MNENGQEITCVTFRNLTPVKRDQQREDVHIFDEKIHLMYGPTVLDVALCVIKPSTPEYDKVEEELAMPDADVFDTEGYDGYIASQVLLPKGMNISLAELSHTRKMNKAI